jgi:hypothetical protein
MTPFDRSSVSPIAVCPAPKVEIWTSRPGISQLMYSPCAAGGSGLLDRAAEHVGEQQQEHDRLHGGEQQQLRQPDVAQQVALGDHPACR